MAHLFNKDFGSNFTGSCVGSAKATSLLLKTCRQYLNLRKGPLAVTSKVIVSTVTV